MFSAIASVLFIMLILFDMIVLLPICERREIEVMFYITTVIISGERTEGTRVAVLLGLALAILPRVWVEGYFRRLFSAVGFLLLWKRFVEGGLQITTSS